MESPPTGTAGPHDGQLPRSNSWALPLVLATAVALFGMLLIFRPGADGSSTSKPASGSTTTPNWTPAPRPEGQTVSLTIDFGNGARREFDALPWSEGLTLGKLMRQAAAFRPGLTYTQKGLGEMTYLTSLEGVANDGDNGRYWFYSVDDARGKVSFEIQPLQPAARVLWVFQPAD